MIFCNTVLSFTPELFILISMSKSIGAEGARGRKFLYTSLYMFTRVCITNWKQKSNSRKLLASVRIFIMLNVRLAKAWWVLLRFPRKYAKTSNTSKGWNFTPYIWCVFISVWYLKNAYSSIFFKSKYSATWYFSSFMTVYNFLENLKMLWKLSYKCKFTCLDYFQLEIEFYYKKCSSTHFDCVTKILTSQKFKQ